MGTGAPAVLSFALGALLTDKSRFRIEASGSAAWSEVNTVKGRVRERAGSALRSDHVTVMGISVAARGVSGHLEAGDPSIVGV